MTITDCSRATGISTNTISKAVRNLDLEASQTSLRKWYILPAALLTWSKQKWKEGRCNMFPVYYTAGFIVAFHSHELSPGLRDQIAKEAKVKLDE